MASTQPFVAEGDVCPDPSAHTHGTSRLQDQASKAALYVTRPEKFADADKAQVLGSDGKLSSTSAATSLKHAKPHELPSFPSVGIDIESSGNTAANHATSNFKSFEHWKPNLSSSAGKAALVAHKDGGKVDLWSPSSTEHGYSAAGAAMGKQSGLSPRVDYGFTHEGRQRALMAATLSVSNRGRSESSPTPPISLYPDAHNAGHNALSAATVAHKPAPRSSVSPARVSSPANEAARFTHMASNANREMYSAHPPIDVTANQQKHNHALQGASLATQRQAQDARTAGLASDATSANAKSLARVDLQEQAQKLAQDRLAKLDPDGVLAYREHYGYARAPQRNRLSMRNRRPRSSSGGTGRNKEDNDEDDAKRAGRIRHQMSRFNDQLASVDAQKRKTDRSTLMAAAEKSVRQRMSSLDQQIFDETGKVTPAVMEQWEAKARQRAAAQSEKRLEHHGMVDVGGGRFMEQSEVEKIAASRMQPTLDELDANAEKQRARDEEIKLDQERRKDETATQKQREKETKIELKKARQEEKEVEKAEKRILKEEKKQEKAAKKERERKSEDHATNNIKTSTEDEEAPAASNIAGGNDSRKVKSPKKPAAKLTKGEKAAMEPSTEEPPGVPTSFDSKPSPNYKPEEGAGASEKLGHPHDDDPSSPEEIQTSVGPMAKRNAKRDSRVRSWLSKIKRSGRHTRSHSSDSAPPMESGSAALGDKAEGESGLYSHYKEATKEEDEDVDATHSSGKVKVKQQDEKARSRSISPPSITSSSDRKKGGLEAGSIGDEEFEEAKDKFDDDALKTPPDIRVGSSRSDSPHKRGSKFMEEL